MEDARAVVHRWSQRLSSFMPEFFAQSAALKLVVGHCAVLLHGSTTLGIDDSFSDLDLWVLVPAEMLRRAEAVAGTRFFSFTLDGKAGHFNLEDIDAMNRRVRNCDLELIAELRISHLLEDVDGVGGQLIARANQPMSEPVRRAWFCHHYVEMRGFHRNCDNPIERGHAAAVLQGLVPALNHALRAAMVLDCKPYPYIKWLTLAAGQTPTGKRLLPLFEDILDQLTACALRQAGPERSHPISLKLREIRQVLMDAARSAGIDEPWLDRWWEHLTQAKEGVGLVNW
jgi:predicted nucleotidyltransferase